MLVYLLLGIEVEVVSHFRHGFVFVDVSSFSVNLAQRRDASFYVCGETSRFIHRICSRAFTADTIPSEDSWFDLLSFKSADGTLMDGDDFLTRLRLSSKVPHACKQRAEGLHSGKKSEAAAIQKTAKELQEEFITDGLKYIGHLLDGLHKQAGLNTHIIKGLAAFDPVVLFKQPPASALRHFELLYNTFQLRSWVTGDAEFIYRDEYLGLIDHLRVSRSADFTLLSESQDLIDFLMGLEFLQKRTHLLYLFKLCCLCITSPSSQLPVVTIGSIDTNDHQGRFTDVVLPGQSYLVNVPGSISHCVSDQCLSKFSLLSSDFDRSAFSPEYDPWAYVDSFGRSIIFKSLLKTYKSVISGPKTGTVRMSPDDASSVVDDSALKVPSKTKRKRQSSSLVGFSSSPTAGRRPQSSSNE